MQENLMMRDYIAADHNFIVNSWLKSFKRYNEPNTHMVDSVYYKYQKRLIETLLKDSIVKVICGVQNENDLWGYIVYEKIKDIYVVHYAYVKSPVRKCGVLSRMMKEIGFNKEVAKGLYTHYTEYTRKRSEKLGLIYNPYLLSYKGDK